MKIEITADKDLIKKLRKLGKIDFVKDKVKKHGGQLQETMKELATPNVIYVKGYSVGDTKKSISVNITDDGLTAEVGSGMEYTPYVEYGTRFIEPEPVVRPAFNKHAGPFIEDLRKLDE
ncbi:HK97-gp10 family putative phage morphogenesis protein [uncultured Anaerococcus sp.]|jgi:HK97 gp10 family phage protein|uniref:HK97-gp10 family putative phage morphogenesis protein n=1 Tax=uncultured Anaerococcus sp. TaxID=293428 RepID=UPI002803B5E7|nr:HK97-gp10 family putative phage morphogenesis protein [uncultured Anaerococcus sp.]